MRVALVTLNASYAHTAPALRCLGASLIQHGHEVISIERTLKDKHLSVLASLIEADAEVYGFSTYIWNLTEHLALAARLKAVRPEVTIIFGGPEVSYEEESFFKQHPCVDLIQAGEGEEALPALVAELEAQGRDAVIAAGRIRRGEAYEGFWEAGVSYSSDTDRPMVYYESSRGCPYACSYCLSAAETGVRAKPVSRVLQELKVFETMPAVKIVKFVDRTFNFDRHRACAIWEGLLKEEYTKTYHFEIAAEWIDEDTLAVLSRFPRGKVQLEAGVQSTNPITLAAIHRSREVQRTLAWLKRLRDLGTIHIHADLIAGLPHENIERFAVSFDETYPVCDQLQLGFLKLLKGTPLHREAASFGIVASPEPPYEVLRTDDLSFADLLRLHRIEGVLERFGNSGHFDYTLASIWAKGISPFSFFDGLARVIGDGEGLSQLRAIEHLKTYCLSLLDAAEAEALIGRLRLDYYIHECGNCPSFLAGGGEGVVAPIRRSFCMGKCPEYPKNATEVHHFAFDPEGYYVIDRKGHRVTRVLCDL